MSEFAFCRDIARLIIEYGQKISAEGFTKGTWGNISIKDGEQIYITPSGIAYDALEAEDICVLRMDGGVVHAKKKPSSEYLMHLEIYKTRPDVGAIIHTHPVFSTVVSICLKSIPPVVEDAVMILGEELLVSEYALPGTAELAREAVKALGTNNCVFLKNHGLVTVGETIHEAFVASQVAEKTAQIYLEALKIGNVSIIPSEHAKVLRKKYLSSYRQR